MVEDEQEDEHGKVRGWNNGWWSCSHHEEHEKKQIMEKKLFARKRAYGCKT